MDFMSPLLELIKELWGLTSNSLGYIYNLKDKVDLLRNETKDLNAKSANVHKSVKHEEEGGGVQRTEQVANWLDEVQKFVGGVDQVLQEAGESDRIKCLSRCLPRNCRSSYQMGKGVDKMHMAVRELKQKEFNVVTSPSPRPRVLEMPMENTLVLDISKHNEVWECLLDKQVRVIGLYGMGGVGKTTLVKEINKKLSRANHGFDVVIWVAVSRQVNEVSIRDIIRKRLSVRDDFWEGLSEVERIHHLCEVLPRKKFVLSIDDVWARLDLSKIGVPHSSLKNGSKVVFTTRLKQVCHHMEADKTFKVQCLMPEEAMELLENNVVKSTIHSDMEIRELVKDIAQECKGLPLALITVGQAMAGMTSPHAWKHALTTLRNNPHKLSGMVDKVYRIQESTYDSLNDSTIQLCFLYCCLFPKDYCRSTAKLIELWIGEGLLGDIYDVYGMQDKGEHVLESLKMACLLENAHHDVGQYVKMHGVIHDMATWITRDYRKKENTLLVIENEEYMSAEMISKWGEAKKVSIWGKCIRNIDHTPPGCSQLETLLVSETNVKLMPSGFFNSMMAHLMVLDLSHNEHIQSFPKEICNLISLECLNLSNTSIDMLPEKIKNLTCLRWLLLDYITSPAPIPTGAIANLPLIVFSQWNLYSPELDQVREQEIIGDLEYNQHPTDLSIDVFKSSSARKIFQSSNLQRGIRRAWITDSQKDFTCIIISDSPIGRDRFSHLEELYLYDCRVLMKMEIT